MQSKEVPVDDDAGLLFLDEIGYLDRAQEHRPQMLEDRGG